MSKSSFLSANRKHLWGLLVTIASLCLGFTQYQDKRQAILWSHQCLYFAFDAAEEPDLRKWELNLTPDAFVRFRKTYANGRQEYYSFNLSRFKDIDYLGNTTKGTLRIKTLTDDIIVQTYNDRKGNVDSMSTSLKIPVKNMTAERLDSLLTAFNYIKK